jgi:hypothetical protein
VALFLQGDSPLSQAWTENNKINLNNSSEFRYLLIVKSVYFKLLLVVNAGSTSDDSYGFEVILPISSHVGPVQSSEHLHLKVVSSTFSHSASFSHGELSHGRTREKIWRHQAHETHIVH